MLLARLELAGLIASFYGEEAIQGEDKPSTRPLLRFCDEYGEIIVIMEAAIEAHEPESTNLWNHTFIYNTQTFEKGDPWGSTGQDGNAVSLRKIVSGYRSLWDMQGVDHEAAINRIVKASAWRAEKEKRAGEAFSFLIDLNNAGFFCNSNILGRAIERLAHVYTARANDLSRILDFSFSEVDQIEASRLIEGLDGTKLAEIGAWLLDTTVEAIADCRNASCPLEWTVGLALVSSLITAVESFEGQFHALESHSIQYKIQFLALEEISCDLGSMQFTDIYDFSRNLSIEQPWGMASALFRTRNGTEPNAAERLLNARLVAPGKLLQQQPASTASGPEAQVGPLLSVSKEWALFAREACHILSYLRSIDHRILRSAKMNIPDSGDAEEPENELAEEAKVQRAEHLHREELASLIGRFRGADPEDQTARTEIIEEILGLYPLNELFLLERGILRDESGSSGQALEDLLEAICLSPFNWMLWQSFSVVSRKLGHLSDSKVAHLVANYLREKRDDDASDQHRPNH